MAERLAAAILSIEGYESIEPQAPLGGPDDRKDILAKVGEDRVLAAVYFPGGDKSFADVKAKFLHDRDGMARHGCDRFVFLTNQNLTLGERADLKEAGDAADEIYELQRITGILDSPPGYGLRLSYLHIPMTAEDQIAYFDTIERRLTRLHVSASERAVDHMDRIAGRTLDLLDDVRGLIESSFARPIVASVNTPTEALSLADFVVIHRAVVGPPTESKFRAIPVWVADGVGRRLWETTSPDEVVDRLTTLCSWWRQEYASLAASPIESSVVRSLATLFSRFLEIHPFADGNGRVARSLLDQAAMDLIGRSVGHELGEGRADVTAAVQAAISGDSSALELLVSSALE